MMWVLLILTGILTVHRHLLGICGVSVCLWCTAHVPVVSIRLRTFAPQLASFHRLAIAMWIGIAMLYSWSMS